MNNSQKHHFLPKAYLSLFTKHNGTVHKVNIHEKSISKNLKEFYPSALCFINNYYKINDELIKSYLKIEDEFFLEKYGFRWYENNWGKLVKKITGPLGIVQINDAEMIVDAIFNIKIRNPFFRNSTYGMLNISAIIDDTFERLGLNHNQRVNVLRQKIKDDYTINQEHYSRNIHNLTLLENLQGKREIRFIVKNILLWGEWTLCHAPVNYPFVTSDNPGFCVDINENLHNTKFDEFLFFYFPLTPYKALLISGQNINLLQTPTKTIKQVIFNHENVEKINIATAYNASKIVISHLPDILRKTWLNYKNFKS
jgi:hypothetical protein